MSLLLSESMTERRAIYRVNHPEDERDNRVLPVRRFVRSLLRHRETPQFTTSVVAFSNAAYLIELGIGQPDYHVLQASKVAEKMRLTPEETSRASIVAGTLWERYKAITDVKTEPLQNYQSFTPQTAETFLEKLQAEKSREEQKRREEGIDLMDADDSLTKHQLVNRIARRTHKSKKTTKEIIDAALAEITEQILDGKKVVLQGFGTFHTTVRGEKTILTHGVEKRVHAHFYPQFTPGKTLKRIIRDKPGE